jgi:hypothetical protein
MGELLLELATSVFHCFLDVWTFCCKILLDSKVCQGRVKCHDVILGSVFSGGVFISDECRKPLSSHSTLEMGLCIFPIRTQKLFLFESSTFAVDENEVFGIEYVFEEANTTSKSYLKKVNNDTKLDLFDDLWAWFVKSYVTMDTIAKALAPGPLQSTHVI